MRFFSGQKIKFNTKAPTHITSADIKSLKSQVIDVVVDIGGTIIVCAVLHDIARRDNVDQRSVKVLDQIADVFSKQFLREREAYGSFTIDRRDGPDVFAEVEKILSKGHGDETWPNRKFGRIIHTSATTARCCHVNSKLDIILGSFQHCISPEPNENNLATAKALYPRINRLLYR